MNAQIALILGQDGITNGAIYALLALSILLVFTVTRVLFIPQGEFVAFGALTMAALQAGKPVLLVWLLFAFALAEVGADLLARRKRPGRGRGAWRMAAKLAYPLAHAAAQAAAAPHRASFIAEQAKPLLVHVGDRMVVSDFHSLMADAYFVSGNFDEARRMYDLAMDTFHLPKYINVPAQEGRLGM